MGKMCGPTDSLKLRWQSGADTVGFQCESGGEDRIADFDLKLMQIESEHMEIPEQQYKVTARLPSGEFQKICCIRLALLGELCEGSSPQRHCGAGTWAKRTSAGQIRPLAERKWLHAVLSRAQDRRVSLEASEASLGVCAVFLEWTFRGSVHSSHPVI